MTEHIHAGPAWSSDNREGIQTTPNPAGPKRTPNLKSSAVSGLDLLSAWLPFHFVMGAVAGTMAVVLFGIAVGDEFDWKRPRPFSSWESAGVPLFGGTFGLAIALIGWRLARRMRRKLGPRAWTTSALILWVVLLTGSFYYGYFTPSVSASSFCRQVMTQLPPGTSQAAVAKWMTERGAVNWSFPSITPQVTEVEFRVEEIGSFYESPDSERLIITFAFDASGNVQSVKFREDRW